MKRILFFALIVFLSTPSWAQPTSSDPVDAEGWFGTGISLDLKKKWSAEFSYQARYQNNISTYKGSYFSFSGAKGITKRLELQGEYRFSKVATSSYHRFSFGAEYSKKIHSTSISLRALVLNNIQDFLDATQASQKAGFWRTRLRAGFKFNKKWEGYLSTEPIMKFGGNHFVDNWRNTIGVKRKVSSHTKLDLYYMYRPDYAKNKYNRVYHVIGFNVDFKFSPRKH